MSVEQIFNAANKLKNYDVTIDDVSLIKECIVSVEISYVNNTPEVIARLLFNDLYDMNLLRTWRDCEVNVSYIDVYDKAVSKDFVITNVTEKYSTENEKLFVIDMQDKFSYTLDNSFLSKGFKTNPLTALQEYISYFEFEDETFLSEFTENYNFTVPKNMSNLKFFLSEFSRYGYTFYQDKSGICVKSLTDLLPESLVFNGLYLNETDNQLYKNKIISLKSSLNNRGYILPQTRSLYYDLYNKNIIHYTDNDNDKYSINTDSFNLQSTDGFKDVCQSRESDGKQTLFLKESFMRQSELEMVVNGYSSNDINQQYQIHLRGNKSTSDSQAKGNLIVNGYYISNEVTDKIVGDTLIQQIKLGRSDLTSRT